MSTNVDHVECLSGELTISEEGKAWLAKAEQGEGPEWFPEVGPRIGHDDTVIMRWSGERSGCAAEYGALEEFFAFTRGTAEFVLCWEGGEFMTGYRVVDGVMTEHHVTVSLGEPVSTEDVDG